METPTWLNNEFLTKVLEKQHGQGITILSYAAKSAVPPGNNYLSITLRVEINYKSAALKIHHTLLIVKYSNLQGFSKELDEKIDFYSKEPRVYKELIPVMESLLGLEFSPKSYDCSIRTGLVLQDLKEDGYMMADRTQQLDFDHCKEVLTVMAKFHASSIAANNKYPELVQEIGKEVIFTKDGLWEKSFRSILENSVHFLGETLRTKSPQFSQFTLSRVDKLWNGCGKWCQPRKGKLNVLNHGDLWTTNILFQYNKDGHISGVKLIDYQLTRYGSPVYDLTYFIWSSANEDVRESRLQDLYRIYLNTLNLTLSELNCEERLSYQELQEDLLESADLALFCICHMLPLFLFDSQDCEVFKIDDMNLEDQGAQKEQCQTMVNGKHFQRVLPALTKQFIKTFLKC